jgi:glycosyltransferase involved in cell wall biosynthesis
MNDAKKPDADATIAAYGPILHGVGFHAHTTGFFRALNRRHRVVAMNAERQVAPADVPGDVVEMLERGRRLGAGAAEFGIGIGPIDSMSRIEGRTRIGFVVWETSRLLASTVELLRGLDELWTPSAWGRQVLVANGIDENRVFVVPEGVDAARFTPGQRPENRRFRFLCNARWQARKGTADLIDAFCREFGPDEPVELVLRCIATGREPLIEEHVAALRQPHPPIVGISRQFDGDAIVDLYRNCDAFVLPTKGEGWGLPIVEAMACGLPVIVTNHSAPADYLDHSIAYLIGVASMIPAYDPIWYPHRTAYGQWAQPDVEHLQSLMRHVFEHRDEAKATGQRARDAVSARLTWDRAATVASDLLGV